MKATVKRKGGRSARPEVAKGESARRDQSREGDGKERCQNAQIRDGQNDESC
jgi:hypothetical protein